jgi:hypothetical protein
MKKLISIAAMAIMLSGCAVIDSLKKTDEQNKIDAELRPVCKTDAECKMAMSKAYAWIQGRCDMKVQIFNEFSIETFNPTKQGQIGCSVVKSATSDGNYELILTSPCPYGGCMPEYWRQANFNRAVKEVLPKGE